MKTLLLWIVMMTMVTGAAMAQANLRAGDTIEIRIAGIPAEEISQFSGVYTIDGSGMINVPFIGATKAAGLQASTLQQSIENRLKSEKIFTRPTITVTSTGQVRLVSVGGSVRSPQRVPYTADLTLMTAINAAGGFNDFADRKRVRLIRDGKATIYNTLEFRKDPSRDPALKPGDQIEVPQASALPFF